MDKVKLTTKVFNTKDGVKRVFDLEFSVEVGGMIAVGHKVDAINAALTAVGLTDASVSANGNTASDVSKSPWFEGQSVGVTLEAPSCPTCKKKMKESQVQELDGQVSYYCTAKVASGYCKARAAMNISDGETSFWEVKK